ncbi:MAG TPA: glycosyltransferase family 2 protein [Chitinophagaceae bacterium]
MIPVYNCSDYMVEALKSVLQQDPGEEIMQIEVVDDCSTDTDVKKLVQSIGKGRVLYYRQPQNVGSVRNFETCLNRANGRLIHLLHGDDKVKMGFYNKLLSLFHRYPEAGAAFCSYAYIDNRSELLYYHRTESDHDCVFNEYLLQMAEQCATQYVSIAVKREVYEKLGGFFGVTYGEDWEMWTRIAKHYPLAYTPEVLAEYRVHNTNISADSFRTGQNIRDISTVIDQISNHVPPSHQQKIKSAARKHYAKYMLANSEYIWHVNRDRNTVFNQVEGALQMHTDHYMILKTLKIFAKILLHPFRKFIGNLKD